nr:protein ENHANCED DISEASE RESISTANCE 2-like isoform X1 [Ipomoea batatas]
MDNSDMGVLQSDSSRMEGWLYLVRSNRIGLQYSRKRYFVLQDHLLKSFKSIPLSKHEEPIRSAIVDSCIRVTDNGRESIQRKLGANSPDEAASWIQAFQEAAFKADLNRGDATNCQRRDSQSLRLNCPSKSLRANSVNWTFISSSVTDAVGSDVVAPSSWTISGCQNGLRLFKETKDKESHGMWDDHPAIMAVAVVDGTSETIFQTFMSLGPSRSEWDFCFYKGSVIEHLDGHTDIVHKLLLRGHRGMKRRDLLLQRYWRREDDGTYVILYHSVVHNNCPQQKGYVRACLKSGGYVISPINQGRQSVVKHMLAIDWKFWRSYLRTSLARSITICMLRRLAGVFLIKEKFSLVQIQIAFYESSSWYLASIVNDFLALRELFRTKVGEYSSSESSGELVRVRRLNQTEEEKVEAQRRLENGKNKEHMEEEIVNAPSEHASLIGLDDAEDEFFDVSEPLEYQQSENGWPSDYGQEIYSQDTHHPRLSTAAVFVKRLHDLAVQKRGYVDLHGLAREDNLLCSYGSTLPKDSTCNLLCSWTESDPSTFLIRGATYLDDRKKFKAKGTLMQMVGADWLKSDKREDDLGGRPGGIVQKYAVKGGPEFFFIVNIQVPGSTTYNLALYYMMNTSLEDAPLLKSFVEGDDAYRSSRFKLIPYISKGSWIVKQSVGKKACLVGQALEINYFRGRNYLELGVDIGSSTVARGVVSLVLGYLNNLVIEMAFLVQANTPEELPEYLLGTCRLNHLDAAKAVLVKP